MNACDQVQDLLNRLQIEAVKACSVNTSTANNNNGLKLIAQEGVKKIAELEIFADQDCVAEKLYSMAIDQLKKICVNKISRLVDSGQVEEAIGLTWEMLGICRIYIEHDIEVLWAYRISRVVDSGQVEEAIQLTGSLLNKYGSERKSAVESFWYKCISRLVEANKFDEAITLTKRMLEDCESDIKNMIKTFWFYRCQHLEKCSKGLCVDQFSYYQEMKVISHCFRDHREIQMCFKRMVRSVGESLLNCPDGYEYSETELACLKTVYAYGDKRAGQRLSKNYLEASKKGFADRDNVDLVVVNHACACLWNAQLYVVSKVPHELSAIGISFFQSLGVRFGKMKETVRSILLSKKPDKAKVEEAKSWLQNVFLYGTRGQKHSVRELNTLADSTYD